LSTRPWFVEATYVCRKARGGVVGGIQMASGQCVPASKRRAVYQTKGTVITTNFTGTVTAASIMGAGFPR